MNLTRDHEEIRPSANAAIRPAGGLLVAVCYSLLSFSATAASNVTDDEFSDYYTRPCELGGPTLRDVYNWSRQEINAYQDAICSELFTGGYTSGDSVSSSAGLGSISATSSTSEVSARQQTDSIEDRLNELQDEEDTSSGWGLLLSAQTGESDHDETRNELGYDSDINSVVIGLDYRYSDALVTGLAVGFTDDDTDYDGNSGNLDTDSESIIAYITYLVGGGGYVNGYIGYASLDYDNKRRFKLENAAGTDFIVNDDISANYDGDQNLIGASAGYDWPIGNYTVGVFTNYDYSETDIDGYKEKGSTGYEMVFPDQRNRSSTISLGVNGSVALDMGWAWLIPNASVQAVHESQNDSDKYKTRLVLIPEDSLDDFILETDDPDRDYGIVSLGAVIATHSGAQYFVTYEQVVNYDDYDIWSLSAGALIEF